MTILGSKTEFYIDGVWTDYTSRIRGADGISINNRGLVDHQSSLAATQCGFTINNRDGLFSNRNPNSALFGMFPMNTLVRHSVPVSPTDNYLRTFWPDRAGTIQTADKAVLDIAGDLDIRIEVTPDTWRPSVGYALAGKATVGNTSWVLSLNYNGQLVFTWTPDGSTITHVTSGTTDVIPENTQRLALRVTFDVSIAGNNQVDFYTSPTIGGSWTLLHTTVTAGVASLFNSTAALEVGSCNSGSSNFSGSTMTHGKIHAFELYSGIGGTLVAKMDARTRSLGDTSWSDGLGTPNTWDVQGNARITSDQVRFVGETSSLPTNWDATGQDVFIPITAAGPFRRYMQGGQALRSPIYRNLIQYSGTYSYWPMEAPAGASTPDSAGTKAFTTASNDISFSGSTPTGLDGSGGALTLNSASSFALLWVQNAPVSVGTASFIFYFKLTSLPASTKRLISLGANGTAVGWTINISNTGYDFSAYGPDGTLLDTDGTTFGAGASPLNQWIGMQVVLTTETTNVRWTTLWHAVGSGIFYTTTLGGKTFAGSTGRFHSVRMLATEDAAFAGAQFAHVMFGTDTDTIGTAVFADSSKGYTGETAGRRLMRLASEEGLNLDMYGDPDATFHMGVQRIDTTTNLFQDAVTVDDGILSEARDIFGLQYMTRYALGEFYPTTISYTDSILSGTPVPVDDDRYVINDLTGTSPSGTSRRSTVDEGPMSTQDPPNGVGRYPGTISFNPYTDDDLQQLTDLQAFIRTWDEARIPQLSMEIVRTEIFNSSTVKRNALALDVGHSVVLSDLPSFMPPNDMSMIILGYNEIIGHVLWTLSYNTIPRGPYKTHRLRDTIDNYPRLDATASTLNADIITTATSLVIKTASVLKRWVDSTSYSAEFPFDIGIKGERITVTAITVGSASGSDWLQTATVSRSVNGIVKEHTVGDSIFLFEPAYIGA